MIAQTVRKLMDEVLYGPNLEILRNELEGGRIDGKRRGTAPRSHARVHHREFVNQRPQCRPHRLIDQQDHIQRLTSAPRDSRTPMPRKVEPKREEPILDLAVSRPHFGGREQEGLRGVHATSL